MSEMRFQDNAIKLSGKSPRKRAFELISIVMRSIKLLARTLLGQLYSICLDSVAVLLISKFYYGGIVLMEGGNLHMESDYLTGKTNIPKGESILEQGKVSNASVIFSILMFICSACGVIACGLVLYGLIMDRRKFLLPWILVVVLHFALEIAHFLYLLLSRSLKFEPVTAIFYTVDFFLLCLNVYCFLCIVSQYQVYRVGRGCDGLTKNTNDLQGDGTRHVPMLPTPDYSYHRGQNHNNNDQLLSKSQPLNNTILGSVPNKSPIGRRRSSMLRKHVQFPEDFKCVEEEDEEILCTNPMNIDSPPSVIVSLEH